MDFLRSLFKGDRIIWIIFLLLCVISIIEVFSAASTLTYKSGDHWEPIRQHVFYLVGGVIVVILFHRIPYRWFQMFPLVLIPLSIVLLGMTSIMGFITGDRINGAARWTSLLGVQFQPSELGKMALVIFTAFALSKKQTDEGASPKAFTQIVIASIIVCGLIAPENLSTALLLFGVVVLMLIIGRTPKRLLFKLFTGVLILGAFALMLTFLMPKNNIPLLHRMPTWKNRILDFVYAKDVPAAQFNIEDERQKAHARIAIASSNPMGKGPGNSVQRDFLSQAFSDFIYAIIIEELGLVGGALVVILYIWLLIRVGKIAKKCNRTFPAFLVMGIGLLLVSQALLNMMVAVGLFPITGQPLPLISKGGTSTFVNCAYIGMILSVSRYTKLLEEEQKATEQQQEERLEQLAEEAAQMEAAEPTAIILNEDEELK
ncbi:FtsW/RodA/SpoVE family cell cycle protein [Bacteroides sp. 519]|uniref:FtsW/RodA/SpoVE family cell cycle protein n=1 Tax=Bacteroides sp. 519 TaxID=2302937 RepID=UPI0013D26191|nr:FtsW/RodA/SpoVE family cell cycle protein [Bacteroides sp. 519]NDV57330.1 FtsW/RodA/SpoVE family cell cycle protein [Bacteroides sp. 519]